MSWYARSRLLVFKRGQSCIAPSNGGILKYISMKSLENENRYPSLIGLFLAVGQFQRTALVFPTGEDELAHPVTQSKLYCFASLWHISSADVENVILTTQWLSVSHAFVLSGCTLLPFCCWSDSGLWFFQGHYLQGINLFASPCLLPLIFVFLSLFVLSDRANTIDGAFSSQYP